MVSIEPTCFPGAHAVSKWYHVRVHNELMWNYMAFQSGPIRLAKVCSRQYSKSNVASDGLRNTSLLVHTTLLKKGRQKRLNRAHVLTKCIPMVFQTGLTLESHVSPHGFPKWDHTAFQSESTLLSHITNWPTRLSKMRPPGCPKWAYTAFPTCSTGLSKFRPHGFPK